MIPFWHFFWLLEYPEYANGDCWNQKNYIKYWFFLFWPALECAQNPKADQNMQQLLHCKTFFEKENKSFHFFVCINLSAVQVTWIALQSFLFSKTIFFPCTSATLLDVFTNKIASHIKHDLHQHFMRWFQHRLMCRFFTYCIVIAKKYIYAV